MVGAAGFVTDAATFSIAFHIFGFGHYGSRLIAFLLAVSLTWMLNRTFTFKVIADGNRAREYMRYLFVQVFGALINITIYGLCIENSRVFFEFPILALILGSISAMFFNYTGAYRFVYRIGQGK